MVCCNHLIMVPESDFFLFFFNRPGEKSSSKVIGKDQADSKEGETVYYCSTCRYVITTATKITEVNGQHRHVYANPSGNVFEIGCFSNAKGCFTHGLPTSQCTWFAGFTWRYGLCKQCHAHLGWKYSSQNLGSFWGLILEKLICHTR